MNFDFQDLSGTFSVADIAIVMVLSFALSAMTGWVYRFTGFSGGSPGLQDSVGKWMYRAGR